MASKGILGTKLGMTQVFDEDNRVVPVTVVQAEPNTVTQIKTVESDGYVAVQLAYGARKRTTKPMAGTSPRPGSTARACSPSCG
jgi:large subunit ribosomal protein L3